MSIHQLLAYLRYRWHALGRHGTHSPFVYQFVERVLMQPGAGQNKTSQPVPGIPDRYQGVAQAIIREYDLHGNQGEGTFQVLESSDIAKWPALLASILPPTHPHSIIAVVGIHDTPLHEAQWIAIATDAQVPMSIDLYGIGLLLFRPEFKVKQHFVLQYPVTH